MPFFLARLSTSSLRSSFSSYLTTSFTLANFIFLAHATLNSKQVRPFSPAKELCSSDYIFRPYHLVRHTPPSCCLLSSTSVLPSAHFSCYLQASFSPS